MAQYETAGENDHRAQRQRAHEKPQQEEKLASLGVPACCSRPDKYGQPGRHQQQQGHARQRDQQDDQCQQDNLHRSVSATGEHTDDRKRHLYRHEHFGGLSGIQTSTASPNA